MEKNPLIKKIERTIAPTAESMGYEIVRVLMVGAGKPTLQIMAEKPDGTMDVEDCGRLSQAVSALLDVENVLDGAYFLEVSSPGIDRPLTRLKDFETYKGHQARVECDDPIDGQKKFKGLLKGLQGESIAIETEKGEMAIPFRAIHRAKLLLTDEMLGDAQPKQKKILNPKKTRQEKKQQQKQAKKKAS